MMMYIIAVVVFSVLGSLVGLLGFAFSIVCEMVRLERERREMEKIQSMIMFRPSRGFVIEGNLPWYRRPIYVRDVMHKIFR